MASKNDCKQCPITRLPNKKIKQSLTLNLSRYSSESIKYICDNIINKHIKSLTLISEFKIKDEGWRHLAAITMLIIKGNKVIGSVPKRYIEQLEYMGYDTNVLEYELKE